MNESSTPRISVEYRPPEDVFALLGNDSRVEILRALAEAEGPLPFSELRDRVGMRDSGQFNYHLGKLGGTFVKGGEEGYELTIAGQQVVGALVSGTYTADASVEAIEVDDPCPVCGATPLVVTYGDEHAHIDCLACDEFHNEFGFPPGTLDQYDPEELPAAFDRWMMALFHRITSGFCASCAGRLSGDLDPTGEPPRITWRCERCGETARSSAVTPLIYHPGVEGFLYEHGIDSSTTPSWRLLSYDQFDVEADESGATVRLTLDGETMVGTVDSEGRVERVERLRD